VPHQLEKPVNTPWPKARLGEVLRLDLDRVPIDPSQSYPMVGVYSFGRGLFDREPIEAGKTSYRHFYRLKADHVVMSQLFGWEGALAISSEQYAGKFVSPQFPTFLCENAKLDRIFLGWLIKRPIFWEDLGTRTSGMGDRRRTLNPTALFACEIPLPPLAEQRRIVARIEELAAKIAEARRTRQEVESELETVLSSVYRRITESAGSMPMESVAPLTRRPVPVDIGKDYPQVAVRSFGRGTFHKPPLKGNDVTWQKPYLVRTGDILISNIKAWEGAIAVATASDDGRVGSHRYLTCVPRDGIVTARFVCFHLLTPKGLRAIGEASPGSADRNRTLGTRALMQIPIPVPALEKQLQFDTLCQHTDALRRLQSQSAAELDALLPSILDKAFNGGL
jgi:type I restriction enzyme, S subunit